MELVGVALGGAVGALLRWWVGELVPWDDGFPWTTFGINLTGSALLAALPALSVVRRRAGVAAALGPGLLGGYTTLSAYSEQARSLLADGRGVAAVGYVVGSLVACVMAVAVVSRLAPLPGRDELRTDGDA